MAIWDNYGNWDDIANIPSLDGVKAKITGHKHAWIPNYCPPPVAYAFNYASSEYITNHHSEPAILDFGCGLGRNAPLLSAHFQKVIGFDRSDMINRLTSDCHESTQSKYAALYYDVDKLLSSEEFCIIYDSVVFQHLADSGYIEDMLARLEGNTALKTFVSVHNYREHRRPPHIHIMQNNGWSIWHTENETLSFEGALHSQVILRRW